ncbi:hypothetical protein QBC38DRAFT_444675 [Podospora fimiseda]|uniref:Secreted protein n=1 Tax=Podospora fimiseda TaxID=252190 RepID=A0AAN7H2P3_9PEZI|nr:hypothetical protein QBC38DRAFT_444675 [Podospora fimiseda]
MVNFKPVVVGIMALGFASASALKHVDNTNVVESLQHIKRGMMSTMEKMEDLSTEEKVQQMNNLIEQMNHVAKRTEGQNIEETQANDMMQELNQMVDMINQMAKRTEQKVNIDQVLQMIELHATDQERQLARQTRVYFCNDNFWDGRCGFQVLGFGSCYTFPALFTNSISSVANLYPALSGCRWYTNPTCQGGVGAYLETNFADALSFPGSVFNNVFKSVQCRRRHGPPPGKCDWDRKDDYYSDSE